ncbi:phage GP46 family protein [Herbaspirillum chlorophenolicum]|uniref:phage GP46 family protein n=1 Tax=Herbaspirillum chlorophenolicum TaxID=211589 RepID=UPI00067D94E5|nr:phage GP46 family protein [Herbaspirillum chlorophenolicum]
MLKLIRKDDGSFDLAYDDPALQDADAAVATVIYAELYTDAEAPVDRAPDRFNRRGYWADAAAGSGLWHVRRQPLTDKARRETLNIFETRLKNLDPAFTDVVIQEVTVPDPSGNVSSVFVQVTGSHNSVKFIVRAPL